MRRRSREAKARPPLHLGTHPTPGLVLHRLRWSDQLRPGRLALLPLLRSAAQGRETNPLQIMRTRRAHFRVTDDKGRIWRLFWVPCEQQLVGRPLHQRTTYTLPAEALIQALEQGRQAGAPPREDPRQLRFA